MILKVTLIIIKHTCLIFFLVTLPFIVGKLRPKLLFVSGVVMSTLAFCAISIYTYLNKVYSDSHILEWFGWIPLAAIVIQVTMRSAAILPVLNTLMNELYPTEIRTLSIGITQSILLIGGFVTVKIFPDLNNLMGLPSLCILYSVVGVLMILWGLKSIPDNRGKSLVKVEELFEKTKKTMEKTISINVNDNLGYASEITDFESENSTQELTNIQ